MNDFEPRPEEEEAAKLRSAAIEALQSAARQSDPREFDRLTRHALRLIERARAIRQGRRRAMSMSEAPSPAPLSTPERKCIGGPEKKCITGAASQCIAKPRFPVRSMEPAFPSRPGITRATARSIGDGRSGATRSTASMASTGPSPPRAPWQTGPANRVLGPPLALLALSEAIAVAVHFEDVDVVGQPIEQRAG